MAKGVVDVYVSKNLEDNTIVLVVDCASGIPNNLNTIQSGTGVTLQRGDAVRDVQVVHEQDRESSFNYMEVSTDTARILGLKEGMRFVLSHESDDKRMKMQRLTKSRAYGLLLPELRKNRDSTISIGYALLSWLGISETSDPYITLSKGSISKKLRVSIPENELEEDFRLSPANLRAFGLSSHKRLKLEYNQSTKMLKVITLADAGVSKRKKLPVKPFQHKSVK